MTLNLVPGLVTWNTHVKYEGPNSYQSKDIANIKVSEDKQTSQKILCPRSIDAGHKKKTFLVTIEEVVQNTE